MAYLLRSQIKQSMTIFLNSLFTSDIKRIGFKMCKPFYDGGNNHINIFIGSYLHRYLTKKYTKEGGSELHFHSWGFCCVFLSKKKICLKRIQSTKL